MHSSSDNWANIPKPVFESVKGKNFKEWVCTWVGLLISQVKFYGNVFIYIKTKKQQVCYEVVLCDSRSCCPFVLQTNQEKASVVFRPCTSIVKVSSLTHLSILMLYLFKACRSFPNQVFAPSISLLLLSSTI